MNLQTKSVYTVCVRECVIESTESWAVWAGSAVLYSLIILNAQHVVLLNVLQSAKKGQKVSQKSNIKVAKALRRTMRKDKSM